MCANSKLCSTVCFCVAEVPSVPTKLGVANVTKDSVTIAWTRPEYDGGSRVKGYLIDALEKGMTKWVKCATVRTTSHTIKSLREGAEYFFRVRAENHAGLSEPKEMIVPVIVKEVHGKLSYVSVNVGNVLQSTANHGAAISATLYCECPRDAKSWL